MKVISTALSYFEGGHVFQISMNAKKQATWGTIAQKTLRVWTCRVHLIARAILGSKGIRIWTVQVSEET